MFLCTLEKGIFGLILESQKEKCRKYFILYIFFGKFWVFKANIQN
jgi:hypothetical protein